MQQPFTLSDQDLLIRIQQQDEQAFSVLYKRYYWPLYKKAYQRIPVRERVEEIVQDVFVNLWNKAESLDSEGNVRAYLYATLRNNILHNLRTEANRTFYMKKLHEQRKDEKEEGCLQKLYANETEHAIHQIIKRLSPQCRKAFQLSRYEQLSYKEIAERMHVSVNTVEKHIGKALRILRKEAPTLAPTLLILANFYFSSL